jgi:hypothetical protein
MAEICPAITIDLPVDHFPPEPERHSQRRRLRSPCCERSGLVSAVLYATRYDTSGGPLRLVP